MEQNLRKCKTCNLLKMRILDGKFPNGKNKRFRDQQNYLWSGNVCGVCNKERIKELMNKRRKGEQ